MATLKSIPLGIRGSVTLSALVFALAFAGCGNDSDEESDEQDSGSQTGDDTSDDEPSDTVDDPGTNDGTGSDNGTGEAPTSFIRVLHLSPDAPAVDVYAGSDKVVTNLAFGASTDYLEVPVGVYTFSVTATGAEVGEAVLTIADLSLEQGVRYTAVAYGALTNLAAMALVDEWEGLGSGDIRVRAVHAAEGVGEVDVWSLPLDGEPAKLYDNVPFGAAGDYIDVPAGAYFLGIDANEDALPDLVFETPSLPAGTVASLFAVNDGSVSLVAQLGADTTALLEQGTAQVRVLHASPEAPAVDVFVNDGTTAAVTGLAYSESTAWVELKAAGYDFHVAVAGEEVEDAVLHLEGAILRPGRTYTAYAYGSLAELAGRIVEDDFSEPADGSIRVRAIHGADGVGSVDIWSVPLEGDPAKLYDNVPFGAVGEYAEVPAGAYTLGFDLNEDGLPDALYETPELAAGTVVSLTATMNEGVELIAHLDADVTAVLTQGVARVRVLHASPDAPDVDVWVNDGEEPSVVELPFGVSTEWIEVPAAGYNFHITATGAPVNDAVLHLHGVILRDGRSYTAYAYGDMESLAGGAFEESFDGLGETAIRVRPIHAAAEVGEVDILDVTGETAAILWQDVPYGAVGDAADILAGEYDIGFDVDNDLLADVRFGLPELMAGDIVNAFAVNDSGVRLLVQFEDGSTALLFPVPAV